MSVYATGDVWMTPKREMRLRTASTRPSTRFLDPLCAGDDMDLAPTAGMDLRSEDVVAACTCADALRVEWGGVLCGLREGSDQRRSGTQDVNDPVSSPPTRHVDGPGVVHVLGSPCRADSETMAAVSWWKPRRHALRYAHGSARVLNDQDNASRNVLTRGWRLIDGLRFGRWSARVNAAKRRAEAREALARALHGRWMTIRSASMRLVRLALRR